VGMKAGTTETIKGKATGQNVDASNSGGSESGGGWYVMMSAWGNDINASTSILINGRVVAQSGVLGLGMDSGHGVGCQYTTGPGPDPDHQYDSTTAYPSGTELTLKTTAGSLMAGSSITVYKLGGPQITLYSSTWRPPIPGVTGSTPGNIPGNYETGGGDQIVTKIIP
jgi:hypothetical protein